MQKFSWHTIKFQDQRTSRAPSWRLIITDINYLVGMEWSWRTVLSWWQCGDSICSQMKETWWLGKWSQMPLACCHRIVLETRAQWCVKNDRLCSSCPVALRRRWSSPLVFLDSGRVLRSSTCYLTIVVWRMGELDAHRGPVCAPGWPLLLCFRVKGRNCVDSMWRLALGDVSSAVSTLACHSKKI